MTTPTITEQEQQKPLRTITITIAEDLARWADRQVEAGIYPSFAALVSLALEFVRIPGDPIFDPSKD